MARILRRYLQKLMETNKQGKLSSDPTAEEALRDEANKPEPLYDKTIRNFQRAEQDGETPGAGNDSEHKGSSSPEEKDITV
ncbi:MAG: hypothetical protein K0Q66_558 [Chitinophagaceae bacterium]|jgi:hypothetical protein|nr:hypothetical protein [Chitinophagaceae bacterium]